MPTQLGRHFWPNFSFVSGLRVDYLSPTLYLTDLLIALLFFIWAFNNSKNNLKAKFQISNFKFQIQNSLEIGNYWKLVLLVIFLWIGVLFSKNIGVGIYGLIKLIEFVFFGYYVSSKVKDIRMISSLFSIGVIFESFLAVFQFLNSGALGGWLYFLGERMFNAQTPGIAKAVLDGELILRPYGTFSHPNVLAGYLVIGMILTISNIKYQISNIRQTFFFISLAVGLLALFLTMSRVAIILWLIVITIVILKAILSRFKTQSWISLLVVLVFIGSIGIILFSPLRLRFLEVDLKGTSVTTRLTLMKSSILMFQDKPIFGVGLNNFIVNLPHYQKPNVNSIFEFLQPAHNIYLLIMAQTGIIGFIFFLWFMVKTFGQLKGKKYFPFSIFPQPRQAKRGGHFPFSLLMIVLAIGLFDHYWLTLQQGQLLFSLILGLCWIKNRLSF